MDDNDFRGVSSTSNPLSIPEIVGLVVNSVSTAPDLLNCASVNSIWNFAALKRLYEGSLSDMQFRTPDIRSLNNLFVASRGHFARNMSFVKHLLLYSDTSGFGSSAHPERRLACLEKCFAMRHRQDAGLLLRPRGKGLASLTIPFKFMGQDWSPFADLIPTPTVNYLAIDSHYCELLMANPNPTRGLADPVSSVLFIILFENTVSNPEQDKLSNLTALTIYRSNSNEDIDRICQLLDRCNLQFFHLESRCTIGQRTQSNTAAFSVKLMQCLRRQKNLKALALLLPPGSVSLGPLSMTVSIEGRVSPWSGLELLYVREWNQHWFLQLPDFKELRILTMEKLALTNPAINKSIIESVAQCRHLRAVDLALSELENIEDLLTIARGCPLLQKFSVGISIFRGRPRLVESVFIFILHSLPRLEFLKLGLTFRLDGSRLRDIAIHCPRLIVLELPEAMLCLSLLQMSNAYPLRQLAIMRFREVWFKEPRRMMRRNKIQNIVEEWRRIFPKLRAIPCPRDIHSSYSDGNNPIDESTRVDASDSSGEEGVLDEPGLDFNDYSSDWFILRTKIWRALNYGKDAQIIHNKMQSMWRTNLEIETVGWPVVPLNAFCDPKPNSATAQGVE